MNQISPDQLLSQIRSMNQSLTASSPVTPPASNDFGNMLKTTLGSVNEAQKLSTQMKADFVAGTSNASLAEVMIASEKANVGFRAVTEVRNKLVQAYQDIMNMPV